MLSVWFSIPIRARRRARSGAAQRRGRCAAARSYARRKRCSCYQLNYCEFGAMSQIPTLRICFTRDAVLELSERAAELAPSSFNAERYTVDVIFSSGAAVERSDLQGRFLEVLEMSASAADLSEFIGAPVLDAHNRTSSRSIYGTVSAARIDSGRGLATIQLSRTADAAPIVDRIREGTLRNVSHRLSGAGKPRGAHQRPAHADRDAVEAEGA